MTSNSSRRRSPLPPDWRRRRLARFQLDGWTCVDCGWCDPTGRTLECDHIGSRDDHRLDALRTRCGPKAPRNCHGRKTGREAQARRTPKRAAEPHPGMLADPDVDWATISIERARICAALVQSSLEDEGVYDGVEDVVQWLYDLSEKLHPGWYEEAEGDS